MLRIKDKDVVNGVYRGRVPTLEDVIVVPSSVRRIEFPYDVHVKGVMSGESVVMIFSGEVRARQVHVGGDVYFKQGVFCGNIEAKGMICVRGDLVTWMGDIISKEGSIVVSGEVQSAGRVSVKNGAIVSEGGVRAEARVFSLNTWSGVLKEPKIGLAAMAQKEAEALFK